MATARQQFVKRFRQAYRAMQRAGYPQSACDFYASLWARRLR